jgi:hypothetical protein
VERSAFVFPRFLDRIRIEEIRMYHINTINLIQSKSLCGGGVAPLLHGVRWGVSSQPHAPK